MQAVRNHPGSLSATPWRWMPEKPHELVDASSMVGRMPTNEQDPAASTQQFRAFASRGGDTAAKGTRTGLVIGLVIGVIAVVAVVAVLLVPSAVTTNVRRVL